MNTITSSSIKGEPEQDTNSNNSSPVERADGADVYDLARGSLLLQLHITM